MSGNGAPTVDPILDAAAELFERQGYDATTVDAVSERSGYARSTVFRKYGSKSGLLRAIVDAFFSSFTAYVLSRLPKPELAVAAGNSASSSQPRNNHRVREPIVPRTDEQVPQPVLGPPIGVLLAALDAYAARHGPLVRVGLAAKDLPWSRPPGRRHERTWRDLAERCFGLPGDPLACCMLLDALKHIAHDHGRCSPSSALALARTVADLGVLSRGFRFGTRRPIRTG